jgi:hypothetical protein
VNLQVGDLVTPSKYWLDTVPSFASRCAQTIFEVLSKSDPYYTVHCHISGYPPWINGVHNFLIKDLRKL